MLLCGINIYKQVMDGGTVSAKEDVKVALIRSGKTMSYVIRTLNDKYNRKDKVQNLSNKLRRGSLRYDEALEIAEAIGFDIVWVPRQQS